MYQVLAVALDIFHLVWIGVMITTCILSIIPKRPLFKKIYLIVIGTTILLQIVFLGCPLTVLSQALRQCDDPSFSFDGGFTAFILRNYFGIHPPAIVGVTATAILITLAIFIFIACYAKKIPFLWKRLPSFLKTD